MRKKANVVLCDLFSPVTRSLLCVCVQIKEVRLATKVEKRAKAMALRAKELGALGMQVCVSND